MSHLRPGPFRAFLLPSIVATLAWLPAPVRGESTAYEALRGARPDGRSVAVEELVLERDVFRMRFEAGTFHFLAPAGGETFGAVFIGRAAYELAPATEQERRHLAFRTGRPDLAKLADSFGEAVLLFTDDTAEMILGAGAARQGPPDDGAVKVYEQCQRRQRNDFAIDPLIRVLRQRANRSGAAGELFFAFVDGREFPPAMFALDPLGLLGAEEACLQLAHPQKGGFWYSSHRREEVRAGTDVSCRKKLLVDPQHYTLETEVARDTDLGGTTTVRFRTNADALRVLPLSILPSLRIVEAVRLTAEGEAVELAFAQDDRDGTPEAAVLFPAPLGPGEEATIRIRYAGDGVLERDGDGTFRVAARSNWYANLGGLQDYATFDLTFRVPAGNQVIAVGDPVRTAEEQGRTVSVWRAVHPVKVAGFNYGKFKLLESTEQLSGMSLQVYTNPGTPDIISEINYYLRQATTGSVSDAVDSADDSVGYDGPIRTGSDHVGFNAEALARSALADANNGVQVYWRHFGELPYRRLAVTQQSDWTFGQAWPTLIFLPYGAALEITARMELGLGGTQDFIDQVGLHEVAHQWWGHTVGWESYRDEWLSEGFAEFSTALVLQLSRGWEAYDAFWESSRRSILGKPRGSTVFHHETGPLTMGFRLSTERSPSAAQAIVYEKGAYVLHMLRMMMRDNRSDVPDERFFAMLRDFATSYAGRNASTEDFKAVVERHMIPELNATRDGKIDWFFNQWVYGTDVPHYRVDAEIEKAGQDQYRIRGTIAQQGVSDDFLALVPLYLDLGKDGFGAFGQAPLRGNMSRDFDVTLTLPRKPKRVLANAHHDMLAID